MMNTMLKTVLSLLVLFAFTLPPAPADAQIWKRVKEAAKKTVEREAEKKTEEAVREGIDKAGEVVVCLVTDQACLERAEQEGKKVTVKDEAGNTVAEAASPEVAAAAAARPGEGVWANYDFVPGERVIFATDFTEDNVGDFPRRLHYISGTAEVVTTQGEPALRASSGGVFQIKLPEELPETFTLEFETQVPNGSGVSVYFVPLHSKNVNQPYFGFKGDYVNVGNWRGSGLWGGGGPKSVKEVPRDVFIPVRVQVDGGYVKMYAGQDRIANVPSADLGRHNAVTFWIDSRDDRPVFIRDIRIAAGGKDLYDALEKKGRVATQGIYFDTGSDRIRPESTPTLKKIGQMLKQHPDLRIAIEGHTDNVGDDPTNLTLSERRAAAVKQHLVATYGIGPSRLEAKGMGESQPAADNTTAEGRQQNRRVELVRLAASRS